MPSMVPQMVRLVERDGRELSPIEARFSEKPTSAPT